MPGQDVVSGVFREREAEGRFELPLPDGTVYADFRRRPGTIVVLYVFAPPILRGTGAAERLMTEIAMLARREGSRIEARCHYAALWLQRSGEFRDLLG